MKLFKKIYNFVDALTWGKKILILISAYIFGILIRVIFL